MSADVILGRMGLGYGGPSGPTPTKILTTRTTGAPSPFGGLSNIAKTSPTAPSSGLPTGFGAGQGPTQATGQAADNPFNNSFFFQIPTSPAVGAPSDNTSQNAAPSSNGSGYGQYLPLIVVGVIVAGIGYYAFGRKH